MSTILGIKRRKAIRSANACAAYHRKMLKRGNAAHQSVAEAYRGYLQMMRNFKARDFMPRA
jgi:cytochrome c551/c552